MDRRLRFRFAFAIAFGSCLGLGAQTPAVAAKPGRAAPNQRDASLPRVECYARGAADAIEAAGYVGFGPFPIGSHHGTEDVDALVGEGRLCWLETSHFRIGVQLPPLDLAKTDKRQRDKLRGELRALKATLPSVDPELRHLDPWLRAHLIAMRCESSYVEFQRMVGYADREFPAARRSVAFDDNWLGLGPYLGRSEKFVVLVFAQLADLRRYSVQHLGLDVRWPHRYDLGLHQASLFATALDCEGGFHDDTALHCHLVHSLIHNFCDGYRATLFETPVWWKAGLAQVVARRIDPRFPNYDRPPDRRPDGRNDWDWFPRAKALAEIVSARPLAEMATWRDYGPFRFHDYVAAWSRMEFLMQKGDAALARFLHRSNAPICRDVWTRDCD